MPPRLDTIGWLLVGPNARQRPVLSREIDGLPSDSACLECLAWLDASARVCQQKLAPALWQAGGGAASVDAGPSARKMVISATVNACSRIYSRRLRYIVLFLSEML